MESGYGWEIRRARERIANRIAELDTTMELLEDARKEAEKERRQLKRRQTVYEAAGRIARSGLPKGKLFRFFDLTEKGLLDYIVLFGQFGVSDREISRLYEEWQDA